MISKEQYDQYKPQLSNNTNQQSNLPSYCQGRSLLISNSNVQDELIVKVSEMYHKFKQGCTLTNNNTYKLNELDIISYEIYNSNYSPFIKIILFCKLFKFNLNTHNMLYFYLIKLLTSPKLDINDQLNNYGEIQECFEFLKSKHRNNVNLLLNCGRIEHKYNKLYTVDNVWISLWNNHKHLRSSLIPHVTESSPHEPKQLERTHIDEFLKDLPQLRKEVDHLLNERYNTNNLINDEQDEMTTLEIFQKYGHHFETSENFNKFWNFPYATTNDVLNIFKDLLRSFNIKQSVTKLQKFNINDEISIDDFCNILFNFPKDSFTNTLKVPMKIVLFHFTIFIYLKNLIYFEFNDKKLHVEHLIISNGLFKIFEYFANHTSSELFSKIKDNQNFSDVLLKTFEMLTVLDPINILGKCKIIIECLSKISNNLNYVKKIESLFNIYADCGIILKSSDREVHCCFDAIDHEFVVVKTLYPSTINESSLREIEHKNFNHKNIIQIKNSDNSPSDTNWKVVTSMATGGSLENILKINSNIPIKFKLNWMKQICSAIDYIHTEGYIHRDIKPSNIVAKYEYDNIETLFECELSRGLTDNMILQVIDFGLLRVNNPGSNTTKAGTLKYMSPEAYRGANYSKPVDIYSLGITFIDIIVGMHELTTSLPSSVSTSVVSPSVSFTKEKGTFIEIIRNQMNFKQLAKLIEEMTSETPTTRPTIKEVLVKLMEIEQ